MAGKEEDYPFQDKCPDCGSENLDYGVMTPQDTVLLQTVTCKTCTLEFQIWTPIRKWFIDNDYEKAHEEAFKAEEERNSACLDCLKEMELETDIQLCQECMKNYDVEKVWKEHDAGKINALDFNENAQMRMEYKKQEAQQS